MAARSKAWVCGSWLVGLWVRIPPGAGCLSVVSGVCCQVEVCASVRSLVQRSPTECGVSQGDHESSTMRRSWPNRGSCGRRWGEIMCDSLRFIRELSNL